MVLRLYRRTGNALRLSGVKGAAKTRLLRLDCRILVCGTVVVVYGCRDRVEGWKPNNALTLLEALLGCKHNIVDCVLLKHGGEDHHLII